MKEIVAELNPYVFPYLKGRIAPGLIENEMWQICQDFCRKTQIWKEEVSLNIQTDIQEYPFLDLLSDDGEFERIWEVIFSKSAGIIPTDSPGVPATNNLVDSSVFSSEGTGFNIGINGVDYTIGIDVEEKFFLWLIASPTGDITNGLRIHCVLKPSRESMLMTDLMAEYKYFLAAGVKAVFYKMTHLPCGDLMQAQINDQIYHDGIAKVRSRLNQNMTSQELFVTFPAGY